MSDRKEDIEKENNKETSEDKKDQSQSESPSDGTKKEDPGEDKKDQSQSESTPEADKKEEIVSDIIASNPIQPPVETEEEVRAFTKKNVIEEVDFGWFRLNEYLNQKCQAIPATIRIIAECIIVSFLFLVFPISVLFLKKGKQVSINVLKGILDVKMARDQIDNFVQIYIFITCIYIVYIIVTFISDNILYICLSILDLFNVSINELTIQLLQIIRSTSYYWANALVCFLIYSAHNYLFTEYEWFISSYTTEHLILTFLIGYGIWMLVIFIEKFFLNFCTSEIRRSDYRDRIWDINYKTFVFKKLVTISKTSPGERQDLAEKMINDFDPGFYIRHNDIKLHTKDDAVDLVESIFAYLEVQHITFEDIKKYFPENPEEVYEYLAGKKIAKDQMSSIDFEKIKEEAIKLQQDRIDMIRTLQDRESIFNKLDLILASAGTYGCLLVLLALLGIPYSVYLASVGPVFFAFGWIFSDTIKEIYNCFVFLLIKHPYDVGDRVIIDDIEYVVSRTDVLASTFIDLNGKTVYIPTPALFNKTICNVRRSKKQSETLTLMVDNSTSFSDAIKFRDALKKDLSEDNKNFTGEVVLRSFEIAGGEISLVLDIQHSCNFQKFDDKLKRREKCTEIVQNTLNNSGIKFNNSFGYVD